MGNNYDYRGNEKSLDASAFRLELNWKKTE